jgi:hypothetical protein
MKRRGGGNLKLTDFLPDFAKPEEDDWIAREMANAQQYLKEHGQGT